jgi:hypothetical protein
MDSRDELVEEFQGRGFTREQAGTLADLWIAQDGLYADAVAQSGKGRSLSNTPTRQAAREAYHEFTSTAARFERENEQ